MSTKILVKLVALLTALTATLVAIFWLRQGHMQAFWTSLGFDQGVRLNWCEERVSTLHFYESGAKLLEKDGKWMWSQNQERVLDYLRVEKWFAQYCQVPVDKMTESTPQPSSASPIFEAAFINGQRLSVYQYPGGEFRIRDQVFDSETLRKAIKELLAFGEEIK